MSYCLYWFTENMHERIDPYRDKHIMDLARKAHIKRYDKALEYIIPGANVLDIWCGTGYWSFLLAREKAIVTGIDISPEAIQYAQDHYAHGRVNYFNKSVTDIQDNVAFDLITCFEVLEHMDDPDMTIQKCRQLVQNNGTLIISVPNGANAAQNNEHHKNNFRAQDLRTLCANNWFSIHEMLEQYAPLWAIADLRRLITGKSTNTNTEQSSLAKYINHIPLFADIFSELHNRRYTLWTGRTLYAVAKPV